jgi:2-dehydropantoate 2-reductase
VKHSGRGELIVGELPGSRTVRSAQLSRTERVASLFTGTDVPCRVSANIESDLWVKMIMNCAGNAVSAIAQASYGRAVHQQGAREVMSRAIEETVRVARASGVQLPAVDFVQTGLQFIERIGNATSSTAQDIARGKRTEIDSLNGYIVRRGAELGVPTPVSLTLHALVKLLEESAAGEVRGRLAGWSA